MDDEFSEMKMTQQVEALRDTSLVARNGWVVEVDRMNVFIDLPVNGTEYRLKVNFDNYPQQAPSYQFEGEWPSQARGIRSNKGICIDGTRECYTNYNHDEREDNWDPEVYDLPSVVHKIHRLIRRS